MCRSQDGVNQPARMVAHRCESHRSHRKVYLEADHAEDLKNGQFMSSKCRKCVSGSPGGLIGIHRCDLQQIKFVGYTRSSEAYQ